MKRFITLILMMTTVLTFSQKVIAEVSILESESNYLRHCEMQTMNLDASSCDVEISDMESCPNNCEMMTVVSALHFIEDELLLSFQVSRLAYQWLTAAPPYHYPEVLYRPPFLS